MVVIKRYTHLHIHFLVHIFRAQDTTIKVINQALLSYTQLHPLIVIFPIAGTECIVRRSSERPLRSETVCHMQLCMMLLVVIRLVIIVNDIAIRIKVFTRRVITPIYV